MGFFNFFKSNKSENRKPVVNSIGKFSYTEFDGTKGFKGHINSIIGQNIELLFPVSHTEISNYQTDYYKKIEDNWSSILQQLKNLKPEIDFENCKVVTILIPDKGNEFYDVDAEIVFEIKSFIISVIMTELSVDEII